MRIELQRIESEWNQTTLGCYISVNSSLLDVITPLNNPHEINTIEVPSDGILRLVIRDMGRSDGYLGSVSVSLALITPGQSICLPLFDSPNTDLIISINEAAQGPRLFIAAFDESLYIDHFSSNHEILLENPSESAMASRISILNDPDEFFASTSNYKTIQEAFSDSKQQEIYDIFNIELDNYKEELLKAKAKNKELQQKINHLIDTLKSNSERANSRESSLLDLMNEKEIRLNKCIEINIDLQNNLRKIEYERKQNQEKFEVFEEQKNYIVNIENELKRYQDMLKTAEKARDELTNTLVECSQMDETYAEIKKTSFDDQKCLKTIEKVLEEKTNRSEEPSSFYEQKFSFPQNYIKNELKKSLGKSFDADKIVKIKDLVYKIDGVQVHLALCDDGLYVKHDNKIMTLDEFLNIGLRSLGSNSTSPLSKKRSPGLHERTNENDYKRHNSKPSPSKNFLKSTESSQNKLKIVAARFSSKKLHQITRKTTT